MGGAARRSPTEWVYRMTAIADLKDLISGSAERVGPSAVGLGRGWGSGSGVVVAEGQVLTSAHNLGRGEPTVTFAGGRKEAGEVAGAAPDLDLAVISVDTGDAPAIAWEPARTRSAATITFRRERRSA